MTDMPGKIPRPSGAWQMPSATLSCAATRVMSRPSKMILPADNGRTPEIAFKVVVLPAPLAPMSVTISPSSTVNDRPFSAAMRP